MVRPYDLPFHVGEDIKEEELEEYFCDREEEVNEIVESLRTVVKQHIALVGKRRVGKSSLMTKCKTELKKEGIPSVFVRVEKVIPFSVESFFTHLLREVESSRPQTLARRLKGKAKKVVASLRPRKIGVDIASTISLWAEFDTTKKGELSDLVGRTFEIIDRVGEQCGKLIVMLDEFQSLFEFGSDFLWTLRAHILDLKRVSFLVSSSLVAFEDEITTNKEQPFFNFFILKKIAELPADEVKSFVQRRLKRFGIGASEDASRLFADLSECHPFYVQALGQKCYEIAKSNEMLTVDRSVVLKAYDYLFDAIPQHLASEFGKLTGKMKEIVVTMAVKGLERPRDIAKETGIDNRSIGGFLRKIEQRHGIIGRVDRGRYAITDGFLREWIRRNYSPEEELEAPEQRDVPFRPELVGNYVEILRTEALPPKAVTLLLDTIRNEAYKVFRDREVDSEDLQAIESLVDFACSSVEGEDEDARRRMLDILYLLTPSQEALRIVKGSCYDTLKALYEGGERNKDLVKILDACGHFGDRVEEMLEAIDKKDKDLFDTLVTKLDLSEVRAGKYELIRKLLLKMDSIDDEQDRGLTEGIARLIRRLETAWFGE